MPSPREAQAGRPRIGVPCVAAAAAAIALCIGHVGQALASPEWTSTGPLCGAAFAVAAGPRPTSDAYLAVGGRLFRSRDAWRSWRDVSRGLPFSNFSSVAIEPTDTQAVYFAPWGGGVFHSTDGGETWTPVFAGLPDPFVDRVIVPNSPPGTVFAVAVYTGVFRSRDRGQTWTDVTPAIGNDSYSVLAPSAAAPQRLWLVTALHGVMRSDDGGDSWEPANAGLPGTDGLNAITADPSRPNVAYLARYQTLYATSDAHTWAPVGPGPGDSGYINALVATVGQPAALFSGASAIVQGDPAVYRSRDGGLSWQPLTLSGETTFGLSYLPSIGRVVAFTGTGGFYSQDLGDTWVRTGSGVNLANVWAVATADVEGSAVVAGANGCPGARVARSVDGGRTWRSVPTWFPGLEIRSISTAPSQPDLVYLGAGDAIFRSTDAGATWTGSYFNDGGSVGQVAMIAVHPQNPAVVFAATSGHGLARSTDGGVTFQTRLLATPFDNLTAVAFDPTAPNKMLISSGFQGVARSLDGGATWTPVATAADLKFSTLAFDPYGTQRILAGAPFDETSVYRSIDGGLNWVASNVGITGGIYSIVFDPSAPGEVVAMGEAGLFRSIDGGASWTRNHDLPSTMPLSAAFGPDGRLFVGTWGEGVFSLGSPTFPPICTPGPDTACLLGGKFEVQGAMWDFGFPPGERTATVMDFGQGRAESDQAAFFESFRAGNFELGVKMVDACSLTTDDPLRAYWLFLGGLTNAEAEIDVEDTVTASQFVWHNPPGHFPTTVGDTGAFPCAQGTAAEPCARDASTACLLSGRFRITGTMRDFADPPGIYPIRVMSFPGGRAESTQAAFFQSFKVGNFELGVKMVNACSLPANNPLRAYWTFYGGLTNAESQLVVTQVTTGRADEWSNLGGTFPTAEGRTATFACEE